MASSRIAMFSCLGVVCCAVLALAAQNKSGPSPSSPAREVLRPLPDDEIVPDVIKANLVPRQIAQNLPDESALRYRGISVTCDPRAEGDVLLIQKRIAAQLTKLDFVPDARIQHFQWMEKFPVKIVEWKADIESTDLTPNGVQVRVLIRPVAFPTEGMAMVHHDFFYEDYVLDEDGELNFVGFNDPGPHLGFFPLF